MDVADQLILAMHRPGRAPVLWTASEASRLIDQSPGVTLWLLAGAEDTGLVERVRQRYFRLTSPTLAMLEVGAALRTEGF